MLAPAEATTISIDGSAEAATYVGIATFNGYDSGLLGGVLGALLGSTEAAVFQTSTGLYLYAPDGFPVASGLATTISIDTSASFDLSPSNPGIVDGTSGDDNMDVYDGPGDYEDGDGDRITDYDASGFLGNGSQAGDDTLSGGAGADILRGGSGDDTFVVQSAAHAQGDVFIGGTGPDDTTDQDRIDLSVLDRGSYTINATEDTADSGALKGTVNFDTGETLTFSGIEIICFAAGTEIITSEGPVNVEDLAVGAQVLTMDRGMQPVRWIGSRALGPQELAARPKLKPIKISAGALGNGTPMKDLVVSRQHRILVRSVIAERMFDVQEILVAAIKLVGLPGIEVVEDADSVEYFHILFDQHEIIFSNSAATESLFTGPEALKAVTEDARAEILELFPDIATRTALLPLRHIPEKGAWVKHLVWAT
ncbi:MAG: Hint domain-containing protein, partial [Rhodobacterales bacterium]